ncbi:hypothetical protein Tco_0839670 [Tanacetum coccineum]|uniref:Uncharacterized protein n=1 Tax=Tanacetum coccineum TaxID=301880 RepID=A0ABQ5AVE3_9ASTR
MELPYDKFICSFLERFPTYQLRSQPQSLEDLSFWVFSVNDEEGSQNDSYSSSDRMMVHDMVISAFSNVKTSYNYIVQLWAPVTIGGRQLLSTYRQPFAVRYLYTKSENHRLRCEKYGYNVNVNNESIVDDNEHNCWPEIKSSGPPLSAFLNGLPEISSSVHQEAGPLLGDGYEESQLMGSLFLIPIFNPSGSSSSSDCIGVVECLTDVTDIFSFFEMNRALERVVSHQEVLFYPHKPEVIVSWVEKRQSYSQIIVCSGSYLYLVKPK